MNVLDEEVLAVNVKPVVRVIHVRKRNSRGRRSICKNRAPIIIYIVLIAAPDFDDLAAFIEVCDDQLFHRVSDNIERREERTQGTYIMLDTRFTRFT